MIPSSALLVTLLLACASAAASATPGLFAPAGAPEAGCSVQYGQAPIWGNYNEAPEGESVDFPLCDKAYYSQAYTQLLPSLTPVTVRIKWFVLTLDDGTEPSASEEDIDAQMQYINNIYSPGNISFEHRIENTASSFLRQRNLLPFCSKSRIGDGTCDALCNNEVTGYDGGDCIDLSNTTTAFCDARAGDGTCDERCNYAKFSYDHGDCCNGTDTFKTCLDPGSDLLRWYTYTDFRVRVFSQALTHYPIGVVPMPDCTWCGGASTLPLTDSALSFLGGSVMKMGTIGAGSASFGGGATLVHEMGHVLGQGHTFAGVDSPSFNQGPPSCNGDARCIEPQHPADPDSLWLVGDLCPDTPPTPVMFGCTSSTKQTPPTDCDSKPWENPALFNPMGFNFAAPGCAASFTFTRCQLARQRCHIDAMYGPWSSPASFHNLIPGRRAPSVIALRPRATLVGSSEETASEHPVLLEFAAPLYVGQVGSHTSAESLRFHIRVSTSVGQREILTDWFLRAQGQAVNVSIAKSDLVNGETHVFNVRAEGAGGTCQDWSAESPPLLYQDPSAAAGDLPVGTIIVILVASLLGAAGLVALGVLAFQRYRARRAQTTYGNPLL